MTAPDRTYLAIDLKSFYASAECAARGLDPLTTNLVVADVSRTEKTICLAVSPSLKAYGIPGRARLFEVEEKLNRVNEERRARIPGHRFAGESSNAEELARFPQLKVAYRAAKPRMAYYLKTSGDIYTIYLKYAAAADIHVYSIDEVFIDATHYLNTVHRMSPHDLARTIVRDILERTGITAAAGIGSNMYLAKVAMDIVAKHMPADRDGVRVAELTEESYRRLLWNHRPLTDFWRVGRGYARRLESAGLLTMGDVARCSLGRASDYYNEDLLYRMFGVNAELLIDHAWGREPCTIADIKAYKPAENSLSNGQVLHRPYSREQARLIVREMADAISLELVKSKQETCQIGLYVGYEGAPGFEGSMPVSTNRFGRTVPRPANGTAELGEYTSSTKVIADAMVALYDRIVSDNTNVSVRRLNMVVGRLRKYADGDDSVDGARVSASTIAPVGEAEQLDLFTDVDAEDERRETRHAEQRREHDVQQALLAIKQKYGNNAVLKAMNLEQDATGRDRNSQIGGHAAGTTDEGPTREVTSTSSSTPVAVRSGGRSGALPPHAGTPSRSVASIPTATFSTDSSSTGSRKGPRTTAFPPQPLPTGVASRQSAASQLASSLRVTHRYDDIIDMPGHRSMHHPQMAAINRAAQFMPFAALAGYDDVLLANLHAVEERVAAEDAAGDCDFGA